jgi:hypothetical protein
MPRSVRQPAIVFVAKLVRGRIRVGIAHFPEILDERFAGRIRLEREKGISLRIRDDVRHLFMQPCGIFGREGRFAESLQPRNG